MGKKAKQKKAKPNVIKAEPKRLMNKPDWLIALETGIASRVPVHPNVLSILKLLVLVPLVLAFRQVGVLANASIVIVLSFLLFGVLDYLDGATARYQKLETHFGRILDRVTDYPILVAVSYFCLDIIPQGLLLGKLGVDLLLIVLYVAGRGSTENRIRTAMGYATLLSLVFVSQHWVPKIVTPEVVRYLLIANITFSTIVVFYNLKLLQKRFIADALSGANLLCGIFSMIFAAKHRVDISMLFLMLGAAFDGFDGAAARKFGGTRWGVYSDDVADAVNYGLAPGVALYFAASGVQGIVLGVFYCVFTLSRLVYFTMNKNYSDPNYFCGVPSTLGGLVSLCSIILFQNYPVILGLMVGIACVQMVSFDTLYQHLGRALSTNRRIIYGMPILVLMLLFGYLLWSKEVSFAIILAVALFYGFLPTFSHFIKIVRRKKTG